MSFTDQVLPALLGCPLCYAQSLNMSGIQLAHESRPRDCWLYGCIKFFRVTFLTLVQQMALFAGIQAMNATRNGNPSQTAHLARFPPHHLIVIGAQLQAPELSLQVGQGAEITTCAMRIHQSISVLDLVDMTSSIVR